VVLVVVDALLPVEEEEEVVVEVEAAAEVCEWELAAPVEAAVKVAPYKRRFVSRAL
jgi:hypothetical protein